MWRSQVPLETVLPLCDRIRSAVPKMRKIWANSQLSATRDARLQQILGFETENKRKVECGEVSLEDVTVPKVRSVSVRISVRAASHTVVT